MRVVVAMSGGVDSSVAAALLKEEGHEVIGLHLRQHDGPAAEGRPRCCGVDDAQDARRVAAALDLPFYVMDLRDEFRRAVMEPFADAYVAGRTPNPCVVCNGLLRFRVLMGRVAALGASHLATGHYARATADGRLFAAADPSKDQSYFLFQLRPDALARTLFPLGGTSKPAVRARAAALGLGTAQKAESQEICFVPDDDHHGFVRARRPEVEGTGEVVDQAGRVLGLHDGYWRFTVGQRRGLGVAVGHPVYVLRIDPETRRVVVGEREALLHAGVTATGWTWIRQPGADEPLHARIRHRGELVPATVDAAADGTAAVRFLEPARAATPGQAVVLYAGDEVVGGGWIARAWETPP